MRTSADRADPVPFREFSLIGDGDIREAIVFLHPGLGTARSWGRFAGLACSILRRKGLLYTREEYDLRGDQYSLPLDFVDREADRLELLLQRYAIERAIVIGSSDGATIALVHAARWPARVHAIFSIAAHVVVDGQMPIALDRIDAEIAADPPPAWLTDLHGARGPMLGRAWCSTWRVLMETNWSIEHVLPLVRCPVLALQGDRDENGLPIQLEVIARRVPKCGARLLPGLGHFPFNQAPDSLTSLIGEFVAGAIVSEASPTRG